WFSPSSSSSSRACALRVCERTLASDLYLFLPLAIVDVNDPFDKAVTFPGFALDSRFSFALLKTVG
ncbi:unnamed protein product, partial [Musa acuminata subsp. burmannicoides]